MKIKLNRELSEGLQIRQLKARQVINWLVNSEGFTSNKSIECSSLSDLSIQGKAIIGAQFDTILNNIHIELK